ncbi:uncharacterized protein in vnfD 5'region-like [Planococcus citri]|uniref:uncharacterized protein in vnfD 5'region-like n=1 Tax=Planococcus citri TaxID=170843 RepID=UPI0031F8495C
MIHNKMTKMFTTFSLCVYFLLVIIRADNAKHECQNLPTDATSFATMMTEGMVFVDKTAFIEKLLNLAKPPFVILTRPRRFGKSTFIDMLFEFYSGNKHLFNDTYIAKRMPGDWTKYPIIRMDFGFVTPINSIADIDKYEKELETILCGIGREYGLDCESSRLIGVLIDSLYIKFGQPVVILIDEYDKISKQGNPKLLKQFEDTIVAFYDSIKQKNKRIKLLYITGVSRISLCFAQSGLNNPIDLTFDKNFSSAMGFTLDEIKSNFGPCLQCLATHYGVNDVSQIITNLTYRYDGYRFSLEDDKTKMFNPVSVISCFRELEITDYWTRTGKIDDVIERIKITDKSIEEYYYYSINVKHVKYLYDNEFSPQIPPAVLLHNYGYLTIRRYTKKSGTVILGYSNKEIENAIKEKLMDARFEPTYEHAINMSLREGDLEAFIGFLNDKAFRNFNLPRSQKPKKRARYTVTRQILTALIDSEIAAVYSTQCMIVEDGQTKGDIDLQIISMHCQVKKKTHLKSSTQVRKSFNNSNCFKSDVVITIEITVCHSAIKAMLQLLEYAVKHTNPFRMEIDKSSRKDLPTRTNLLALNIEKIQNQRVKIQGWITIPYRNGKIFVNELQSNDKTAFHELKTGWEGKKSKWGSADLESEKEIVVWTEEPSVTTEETTDIQPIKPKRTRRS